MQNNKKQMTKIKINGEKIIELDNSCHWSVIDKKLYNLNSKQFEGVEGDSVIYNRCNYPTIGETLVEDIVDGYTCYQIVHGKNFGTVVLSADDAINNRTIIHKSTVDLVEP